jgi:hypothetical protein
MQGGCTHIQKEKVKTRNRSFAPNKKSGFVCTLAGKRITFNPKFFDRWREPERQWEMDTPIDLHFEIVKKVDALIKEHEREDMIEDEPVDSLSEQQLGILLGEQLVEIREPLGRKMGLSTFSIELQPRKTVRDTIHREFSLGLPGIPDPGFKFISTLESLDDMFTIKTADRISPEDTDFINQLMGNTDVTTQKNAMGFLNIKMRNREERAQYKKQKTQPKQIYFVAKKKKSHTHTTSKKKIRHKNGLEKTRSEVERAKKEIEEKKKALEAIEKETREKEKETKEKENELRRKELERRQKEKEHERLKKLELKMAARLTKEKEKELRREEKERQRRKREQKKLMQLELKKEEQLAKEKARVETKEAKLEAKQALKEEKKGKPHKKPALQKSIPAEEVPERHLFPAVKFGKKSGTSKEKKAKKPEKKPLFGKRKQDKDPVKTAKQKTGFFTKKEQPSPSAAEPSRSEEEDIEQLTLDEEVKRVLRITDELLGKLPEDVIDNFAQSEDFTLYEKVLMKYKIK